MMGGSIIIQLLLIGISLGCIYGLVAIGFSAIYNASRVVNFSQGAFVMVGGMAGYVLFAIAGLPLGLALAGSIAIVVFVGLLIYGGVVAPLRRRNVSVPVLLLATFATQILLENGAMHLVGTKPQTFPPLSNAQMTVMGASLSAQTFWVLGGAAVLVSGLALAFRFTLVGKAMRAAAVNPRAATLLGISAPKMLGLSFAMSAFLGGVGGVLITPLQYTAFNTALPYGIKGFTAAVFGGMGNIWGAFAGGLILGILEASIAAYVSSGYKDALVFLILMILLWVRPTGLFGVPVEQ